MTARTFAFDSLPKSTYMDSMALICTRILHDTHIHSHALYDTLMHSYALLCTHMSYTMRYGWVTVHVR